MSKVACRKNVVAKSIVIVLVFAGIWQWHRYASGLTLISDADLIALFHRNRHIFDHLRKIAHEDNLKGSIGSTYVDDKELSPQRIEEYRELMQVAGVRVLANFSEGRGLRFGIAYQGSVLAGSSKGIQYLSGQPKVPIYPSLDKACRSRGEPSCAGARHIEGNWWIVRTDDH